jgi:hypothetical protein
MDSRHESPLDLWNIALKARTFNNQKTEANIGVSVLNRMTEIGRPNFERIA